MQRIFFLRILATSVTFLAIFFTLSLSQLDKVKQCYLCSYDGSEFSEKVFFAVVSSKKGSVLCYENLTDSYEFSLNFSRSNPLIISFSQGECKLLDSSFPTVFSQGLPSSPLGEITIPELSSMVVEISYSHPKIIFQNNIRLPTGNYRICFENVGEYNEKVVLRVREC